MLVLDTNMLSAMMAVQPVPQLRSWIHGQNGNKFFTTTISQAEILSELEVMAEGKRRRDLLALAAALFAEDFHGRVLGCDMNAEATYAEVLPARQWN